MTAIRPTPTAIDLFAGAGGLALGLKQAGFRTLVATDIDPDACASFRANHTDTHLIEGDIHDIDFTTLQEHFPDGHPDLLAGGPPCQGFSTVGSKRERDPRNSLFYEFLRAVRQLQPRYILFENVSGFRRMYEGRAFEALRTELSEMGFDHTHAVLNAVDFGLPQHRLRTIVLAWQQGQARIGMPTPTHGHSDLFKGLEPYRTLIEAIDDLPAIAAAESASKYATPPKNDYQRTMRRHRQTLTEHNAAKYGTRMQDILKRIPPGGTVDDLPEHLRPKSYFANTYARLVPDAPSPTITRNFGTPSSSRCVHPYQNRALSTREGARLQSFPDNYEFCGSKTSRNLQIGNAVPPILGQAIGRSILRSHVPNPKPLAV